jgi:phospholipase/carboxylesterase
MPKKYATNTVMIHTDLFDFRWIPASRLVPRSEQKLMIVLHGRGDEADSFLSIKSELKVPGMNYLLLNAPRRYDTGHTWYAFPPNQAHGVLQARARLTALMSELAEQGWAPGDIFFYGFSQGALVSVDFATHFEHKLAGVIAISGYYFFFNRWKSQLTKAAFKTPMLITHGVFDDALPISDSRVHVKKLKTAGLDILWKEFNKDHEIDDENENPFLRAWIQSKLEIKSRLQTRKRSQSTFGKERPRPTKGSRALTDVRS